jgi:hypothetical protein
VPPGTPPGVYRLEVGWYRFEDAQPIWIPWESGQRLLLGEVAVVAPADWKALVHPPFAYSVGVELGEGVRVLGFDAESFDVYRGGVLRLDVVWLALEDGPQAAPPVFRLEDDAGRVVKEVASAPVEGRAPLAAMQEGQTVRDPVMLAVPGHMAPGVYDLLVGRRRVDGTWLAVRRGPFPLGPSYPLATIRVVQ